MSKYKRLDNEQSQLSNIFEEFKKAVIKKLIQNHLNINFNDMIILSMPLAAEEIKDEILWKRFRDILFDFQDRMEFKDFTNLAWSFTKVDYHD